MTKATTVNIRPIPGYEGRYSVTADGRIWSFLPSRSRGGQGFLRAQKNRGGYQVVCLWDGKTRKYHKVHRLVASAWIPNPHSKPQVNHIDGNKENNAVSNLEWCTSSENKRHAWESGITSLHPNSSAALTAARPKLKRDALGRYSRAIHGPRD